MTATSHRIRISNKDRAYYVFVDVLLALFALVVLLPLINIVASSFSSPMAVSMGKVYLWPVEFSVEGYATVFRYNLFLNSYLNTFLYTITGTFINLSMTMIAAYPLARKGLPFKGIIIFLFTFTMLFDGGTIPNYLLINKLGLANTRLVMIIPAAISVYNMIIARTFIQNIPGEMEEAATIDGCNEFQYFFQMVLPLSKTVLSVLALYYAVGHWNNYFTAFLYLSDRKLYPLQMLLREILIANSITANEITDAETMAAKAGMKDLIKYALIITSSVPVLALYPFVKKYFLKGVMIGALKG